MRRIIFVTIVSLLLISQSAHSSIIGAKVERLLIIGSFGLLYVYPTAPVNDRPPCHTVAGNYYSLDLNRPFAREYLMLLIHAKETGSSVTFWGTGTCTDQVDAETLDYILVQ